MPPTPDVAGRADSAKAAGRSFYRAAIDVILTGIVVIVPLIVTIYVLTAAFDFIAGALRPLIRLFQYAGLIESVKSWGLVDFLVTVGIYPNVVEFLTTIVAVVILLVVIVAVGLLARHRYGEHLIEYFDRLIGAIPGFGSIYRSFRRMGDAMLESSVDNFQEVVLVKFPRDDVYVLGFKTSEGATPIELASDETELSTLFLPLAPNPVMGGFLAHVPPEQVRHVDMTVDEAVSTIITSGIATESTAGEQFRSLTDDEVAGVRELAGRVTPGSTAEGEGEPDSE